MAPQAGVPYACGERSEGRSELATRRSCNRARAWLRSVMLSLSRGNAENPVRRMSISSTFVHRAEIRFHEAADALRPFVGCFWVVTAERDATIRVVPDGSSAISIQLQKSQPSEWFLRGAMTRPDERHF